MDRSLKNESHEVMNSPALHKFGGSVSRVLVRPEFRRPGGVVFSPKLIRVVLFSPMLYLIPCVRIRK